MKLEHDKKEQQRKDLGLETSTALDEQDASRQVTLEEVKAMSDQELQAEIGYLCGWTKLHYEHDFAGDPTLFCGHPPGHDGKPSAGTKRDDVFLPDYPHDLNAVHEVENVLTHDQQRVYNDNLHELTRANVPSTQFAMLHATARQRCEALVLCLSTVA